MNTKFKIIIVAMALTITASCKENKNRQDAKMNTPEEVVQQKEQSPDIADASFVDGMTGKAWHNYLQVRTALVNSDAKGVQTAAGNLAESFGEERAQLKSLAMELSEADDIEKQRKLFSDFGKEVEPLFKEGLGEGTIYKQFCPMAFNNTGGHWLSDVDEIRNPYFGVKMLKCGKVTETISK
ncbi:DUF3347 domain-containing protein [Robiginitalea myxolifaciens]|nr:DUF3347 domain-containing protein [Robiginitalea myxolifaciens]